MITINKEQVVFYFNPTETPAAYANSGDTVKFCCQDCYGERITEDGSDLDQGGSDYNNPATGPLYVNGAEPGDILRIEIKSIELEDAGTMCARDTGVFEIEGSHCRRFPIEEGEIKFDNDINIPVKPMIGVIGIAPEKDIIPTTIPSEHGGNMDIKDLGIGSLLYLPVNVPGALLSMGDLHAIQGDGETLDCALEVSGDVIVKVDVLKDRDDIPTPFIVTDSHYITTAADPSLDKCSHVAARKMHDFLQEHSDLTDVQSGMLLSLVGNLRISQLVNPSKGCIMEFPIALAKERFEK